MRDVVGCGVGWLALLLVLLSLWLSLLLLLILLLLFLLEAFKAALVQGHPLRPEILAMYGDNVAMKSDDTLQQYLRLEIKDLVLIGGSQASF